MTKKIFQPSIKGKSAVYFMLSDFYISTNLKWNKFYHLNSEHFLQCCNSQQKDMIKCCICWLVATILW